MQALRALRALTQLWILAALPALAGAGVRFEPRVRSSTVAAAGQEATLDCRVHQLGDKSVSWVRSRDLQILTHAGVVFTADARVSASETRGGKAEAGVAGDGGTSSHVLRIARLRAGDSGRYECQVNTDPKLSLFFNLTVLDGALPDVEVTALTRTVRGHAGAAPSLACLARYVSAPRHLQEALPPLALSWRRVGEEAPLSLQSARGGVSLEAERGAGRTESRLTLAGLRAGDAGGYECCASAPEPAPPACATVTLLLDDAEEGSQVESEAMQRDEQPAGAQNAARAGAGAGKEGAWSALALVLPLLAHSVAAAAAAADGL